MSGLQKPWRVVLHDGILIRDSLCSWSSVSGILNGKTVFRIRTFVWELRWKFNYYSWNVTNRGLPSSEQASIHQNFYFFSCYCYFSLHRRALQWICYSVKHRPFCLHAALRLPVVTNQTVEKLATIKNSERYLSFSWYDNLHLCRKSYELAFHWNSDLNCSSGAILVCLNKVVLNCLLRLRPTDFCVRCFDIVQVLSYLFIVGYEIMYDDKLAH
jgi:hypothetical protein